METIQTEYKRCLSCMEEHTVHLVKVIDSNKFKGEQVEFEAFYEYCSNSKEYSEDEGMMKKNSLAFKDAYRKKVGLLTSDEIRAIREKYDISQKDLSEVLDWGMATITRYENHQIQDRAHDDILRKIDSDPKWFLDLLNRAKERLSDRAFSNYHHRASELYNNKKNQYLIDSIYAIYAYIDEADIGGVKLDLNKVVETINYLALRVAGLHKVKLMKMLWYSDILSYKRYRQSITGLAYNALPMGAVPEGYDQIMLLDGVCYDTVLYGENVGYRFKPVEGFEITHLSDRDIDTIDEIVSKLGMLNTEEIVNRMHEEEAYKKSPANCIIKYSFADMLSLD